MLRDTWLIEGCTSLEDEDLSCNIPGILKILANLLNMLAFIY